jgi:acetyltransferase-like isoleucine patch superfamily enzyme
MEKIMTAEETAKKKNAEASRIRLRDNYLATGKIPLDLMLKMGVKSALFDPWLTFLKYLEGPIGFKLRQMYWKRKLGFMGKGVAIDPAVDIQGCKQIFLDNFVYLGKGTQLLTNELDEGGTIKIGKRCHLLCRILGYGGVEIGNYVGIGRASILSASDNFRGGSRMSGPMVPREQKNIVYGKIVIEDDAFISENSIIMPNVKIGQGAVVTANSFVNKDVAPWAIVGGNPAKFITEREKVKYPPPDEL